MPPVVISRSPAWVDALVLDRPDQFEVITASIPDVATLSASAFTSEVERAYRHLGQETRRRSRYPLRIWNFVPGIQTPTDDGDRYMTFNVGRFAAYREWFGSPESFATRMPTASAVGTTGTALWIHVLLGATPGVAVENPRQVPAYRYSRRYGSRPPCFARATRFESTLLIGGTASIVGEDSRHGESLENQTRETLQNMATLIASAANCPEALALGRLEDVRVHVRESMYAAPVQAMVQHAAPGLGAIEVVEAQLCRRELMVEIEGRASCA